MLFYVGRRLLISVLLLGATSLIVFTFLHVAPGSPEDVLTGGRPVADSTLEAIRARYHLDDPFFVQYKHWVFGVFGGDLGDSISAQRPVAEVISQRLAVTLQLGVLAALLVLTGGNMAGVLAAMKRGQLTDKIISSAAVGLSAIPAYLSGMVLILVFSVGLGWFPVFGAGSGTMDRLYHLVLPAVALSLALAAFVARVTRGAMAQSLDDEYVEAGRAAGFSEWRVVGKHALRNAAGPVLTVSGLTAGYLITSTVIVEVTFGLPGLGSLLIEAVQAKDFAIVQAITLIYTAVFILINLAVDVTYGFVDPRTSLGEGAST